MINDAVDRIQAIEQKLTEKTAAHLQVRLTIRGCLKELRTLSHLNSQALGVESIRSSVGQL